MNDRETTILLVDAEEPFGPVLGQALGEEYRIRRVSSAEAGLRELDSAPADVVLLNMNLAGAPSSVDAVQPFLAAVTSIPLAPPVIAFGWDKQRDLAFGAFRLGAADFLEQPLDVQELKFALLRAMRHASLVRELARAQMELSSTRVEGLLGSSRAMESVAQVVQKVAGVGTSVLITGESGTGKGVVARAIHRLSPRADKPFVEFSICALPDTLMEDELFGHERGAFTGALQQRKGRFEEACGGTIFLDEIGDLPLPLQAKLLRVLQDHTVERIGSNTPHPVDVRVICATNRNLEKMVQEGTFREDLFFRISVVRVHMPPLRDRIEDIPLLAEHFLSSFAKAYNKPTRGFTPGFLSLLAMHRWPGNVRELQNVIERSLVLANGSPLLGVEDLPPELNRAAVSDHTASGSFHDAVVSLKRELVRSALQKHGGNKLRAARELNISRCYLHRLLGQLGSADQAADEEEPTVTEFPKGPRPARVEKLTSAFRTV